MPTHRFILLNIQALGVEVDLGPQSIARCVEEAGVGFMYAPRCDTHSPYRLGYIGLAGGFQ